MFCWKQRIRPSLLSSLWSYRNSSTQKPEEFKLSQQAQRAAWAVKIIDAIQKSQPEKCIYSPSLKEKIIALPNPYQSKAFQDSVKKEVLQMFQGGIKISLQTFNQERFDRAADQYGRIIFCPNYLVTKQMFQYVKSFKYLLVCGNFGISKTISLALYSILARHVNLLYYQAEVKMAEQPQQDKQSAEKLQKQFKQEIQELQQKDVLRKLPKFWYWTINRQYVKKNGWRSIQQSLIFQADQLSAAEKEDLWKCQSLRAFILRLKFYYPRSKVNNKIIIDQINGMASLMRDWKEFLIQKREQIEKINELDEVKRLLLENLIKTNQKQFLQPAKELIDFFYEIIDLGNAGYILNSSVNIETSLFQKPRIQSDKQQFPLKFIKFGLLEPLILPILGNHEDVNKKQMIYSEDLRKDWGRNDFFHFFWFEMQSLLESLGFPPQILATTERIFLSAAAERPGKGYYRTIYIKKYLYSFITNKKQDLNKLKTLIKQLPTFWKSKNDSYRECKKSLSDFFPPETLQKMFPQALKAEKEGQVKTLTSSQRTYEKHPLTTIFEEMFEQFDQYCINEEKQRVKKFVAKGDSMKKLKFMAAIHFLAEVAVEKKKAFKFPMRLLGTIVGEDVAAHFLSEEHNQQLLPINRSINYNETVDFLWSPQQFLLLTTEAIFPDVYNLHSTYLTSFFMQSNEKHPVFRGIVFELLFLRQLNPKAVINFKMFYKDNVFKDMPIKISAALQFIPFNQHVRKQIPIRTKNQAKLFNIFTSQQVTSTNPLQIFNIDEHFKTILAFCSINLNQFASGIPSFKDIFQTNSKCIDFVLIKREFELNEFITTIYTFDITVGKSVEDKIKDAEALLKNLSTTKPQTVKITHIILCPEHLCQERMQINKQLFIQFSSISDFTIQNPKDTTENMLLEVLQIANRQIINQGY